MSTAFTIAAMSAEQVALAIGLAAAEGWNPGLHDAGCFHAADPGGFLIGHLDGEPVGCISAVSYPGNFGFIGLYIVVPEQRGRGYGIQLWRAAMQRLAGHNIGLDGVPAQQANYRRSGFDLAYSNVRYARSGRLDAQPSPEIDYARNVPLPLLLDYDSRHFPAPRASFLPGWIAQPDSVALAFVVHGEVLGYGVIRRATSGWKIGPLFADSAEIAEQLYVALCAEARDDELIHLDVPEVNDAAMDLAQRYGMNKVFGTARMYTGDFPALPLHRVYGVTTFELG